MQTSQWRGYPRRMETAWENTSGRRWEVLYQTLPDCIVSVVTFNVHEYNVNPVCQISLVAMIIGPSRASSRYQITRSLPVPLTQTEDSPKTPLSFSSGPSSNLSHLTSQTAKQPSTLHPIYHGRHWLRLYRHSYPS